MGRGSAFLDVDGLRHHRQIGSTDVIEIKIRRPGRMAILRKIKIKVDGATAATVKARSTTVIELDDAQHELTASIDWVTSEPVTVGPEAGRAVLEVEYGVENLFPRPAILSFARMRHHLVLRRVDESPDRSA